MARPAKAIETTSKHWTKEEFSERKQAEENLRGNTDKVKPPSYLSASQKKIFKTIVMELKSSNILTNLDVYILTTCSISIDRLSNIEKIVNNDIENLWNKDLMATKDKYTKDLFRCCNELSLSPQSRSKLANLNIQVKTNEDDALLKALRGEDE